MTGIESLDVIAETMDGIPWLEKLSTELMSASIQIKREQAEDHKIAEWVRDNGGIENIQDELANDQELAMVVRDALWPDGKVPCCENGNEQIADELDKRLMPYGMEWPRYEDGKPVVLSEFDQNPETISCVAFIHHEAMVDYDSPFVEINPRLINTSGTTIMNIGERVKRPKQDPIGADGLPIKKGDTVYLLPGEWCGEYPCIGYHGGEELEVFEDGEPEHVDGAVQCRDKKKKGALAIGTCYPQPHQLTHTKPDITGADGQPLKVGDTVWDIEGGEHELVITSIELDELEHVKAKQEKPTPANVSIHPSRLTHTKPEPPDSWERLEEDMADDMAQQQCGPVSPEVATAHAAEFVRRAKALAEREGDE